MLKMGKGIPQKVDKRKTLDNLQLIAFFLFQNSITFNSAKKGKQQRVKMGNMREILNLGH